MLALGALRRLTCSIGDRRDETRKESLVDEGNGKAIGNGLLMHD